MLLSPNQIDKEMKKLPLEWTVVNGTSLERVFLFEDFKTATGFVVLVGEKADEMNHHPDITLSWGKVVVSISTHEESGLTSKDFLLAKDIEKVYGKFTRPNPR